MKKFIESPDFKPSKKGTVHKIAVLRGGYSEEYSNDAGERTTKSFYAEAEDRGLVKPSTEVACLVRKYFSDEKIINSLRLWMIVVMHESAVVEQTERKLAVATTRPERSGSSLRTISTSPEDTWHDREGIAFVAPSESA